MTHESKFLTEFHRKLGFSTEESSLNTSGSNFEFALNFEFDREKEFFKKFNFSFNKEFETAQIASQIDGQLSVVNKAY